MNITNVEMRNDMWTNHMYEMTLYIDAEELPHIEEHAVFEDETSKLIFGKSEEGFATFGSIAKISHYGHEPGYRWSSRPSIFNAMLNEHLIEVHVVTSNGRRYGTTIDIEKILPYLPHGFYIAELVETNSRGKIEEVSYHITNNKHEKTSYDLQPHRYDEGGRVYINRRIYP